MITSLPREATIDRRTYTDEELFRVERNRVFESNWLFLAHEGEMKQPGDFRTTSLAGEPVLVVRGTDGAIHAFFNSCRHRGTQVESRAAGSCQQFKCPYHHWKYGLDGRLEDVPRPEAYGDWFRREDYGLVPVLRLETVYGLVFGSLNPEIASLPDYLGAAAPYLEYICTYRGQPYELIDRYEYSINANWKLLVENTLDGYHPPQLHERVVSDGGGRSPGRSVDLGRHGMYEVDNSALLPTKEKAVVRHLSVFPNLLALYSLDQVGGRERAGLRIVEPVAPDQMRIALYCFGIPGGSEEQNAGLASNFSQSWGPGGSVGAEDAEVLEWVQQGLKAEHGARHLLLARGVNGSSVGGREDEHSLRAFWRTWYEQMQYVLLP